MKKLVLIIVLFVATTAVLAQTDSLKRSKEYVKVSNSVATLTAQLTVAQNNLPSYQRKVEQAMAEAQTTADKSSDKAGNLKDAKKAKRKARDAKNAKKELEAQEQKIAKLSRQLEKEQSRLQELESH